jgi:aryl-alcohol dehydrogenase-like predicted oxidoreductase
MTAVPTTRLGRHGLVVGRLCLGTMNFGWHTPQAKAFAILDRALELGLKLIDTADVYGWTEEPGATEKLLGAWFALGDGRREATVLARPRPTTRWWCPAAAWNPTATAAACRPTSCAPPATPARGA